MVLTIIAVVAITAAAWRFACWYSDARKRELDAEFCRGYAEGWDDANKRGLA